MKTEKYLLNIDALVLAGGRGTRLQPIVGKTAKVLAQVGGKPFLFHLLSQLKSQGIQRVVLALGYLHQEVLDYLEKESFQGLQIIPVVEDELLGTAGAIRNALQVLESDPVLVLNGDTYTSVPLESLLAFHQKQGANVTLATTYKKNVERYGSVEMDDTGRVISFIEKGKCTSGHVNAGIYVMSRQIIQMIPKNRMVSWEQDTLPSLVDQEIFAWRGLVQFLDIGTPASYQRATDFLKSHDH